MIMVTIGLNRATLGLLDARRLACTKDDACANGGCGGTTIVCDDTNPCTTDGCDPASGCTYLDNTSDCDDGDICTTESCNAALARCTAIAVDRLHQVTALKSRC